MNVVNTAYRILNENQTLLRAFRGGFIEDVLQRQWCTLHLMGERKCAKTEELEVG